MDNNTQKTMAESSLRKAIGALHKANDYNVEKTKADIAFYVEFLEACNNDSNKGVLNNDSV